METQQHNLQQAISSKRSHPPPLASTMANTDNGGLLTKVASNKRRKNAAQQGYNSQHQDTGIMRTGSHGFRRDPYSKSMFSLAATQPFHRSNHNKNHQQQRNHIMSNMQGSSSRVMPSLQPLQPHHQQRGSNSRSKQPNHNNENRKTSQRQPDIHQTSSTSPSISRGPLLTGQRKYLHKHQQNSRSLLNFSMPNRSRQNHDGAGGGLSATSLLLKQQQINNHRKRRLQQSYGSATGVPLPRLVKPTSIVGGVAQNIQSRSNSNFFSRSQPVGLGVGALQNRTVGCGGSSRHSQSPAKMSRKNLQQKLQMRSLYGGLRNNNSTTSFVEKGAFGGAMQEIVQDQIDALQSNTDEVGGDNNSIFMQQQDGLEKTPKIKKKFRVNQILSAANRGRSNVSANYGPILEMEDVAHQYQNLKIDFNKLKDENTQLNTRLTKLQRSAHQRDEKLLILNQEMKLMRQNSAQKNPMSAVQSHRFPDVAIDKDNQSERINHNSQGGVVVMNSSPIVNLSLIPQVVVTSKAKQSQHQHHQQPLKTFDTKVEQMPIVISLKSQVSLLIKKNESLEKEVKDMKMSTKVCVYNELDIQLDTYTKECQRLRKKLEFSESEHNSCKKQIQVLQQQQQTTAISSEPQLKTEDSKGQGSEVDNVEKQPFQEEEFKLAPDQESESMPAVAQPIEEVKSDEIISTAEQQQYLATKANQQQSSKNQLTPQILAISKPSIAEEAEDEQKASPVAVTNIDKNVRKVHKKDRLRGARAKKLFGQYQGVAGRTKRFNAQQVYEHFRSKNMQITELNRQLKACREMHQQQIKLIKKKNREMARDIEKIRIQTNGAQQTDYAEQQIMTKEETMLTPPVSKGATAKTIKVRNAAKQQNSKATAAASIKMAKNKQSSLTAETEKITNTNTTTTTKLVMEASGADEYQNNEEYQFDDVSTQKGIHVVDNQNTNQTIQEDFQEESYIKAEEQQNDDINQDLPQKQDDSDEDQAINQQNLDDDSTIEDQVQEDNNEISEQEAPEAVLIVANEAPNTNLEHAVSPQYQMIQTKTLLNTYGIDIAESPGQSNDQNSVNYVTESEQVQQDETDQDQVLKNEDDQQIRIDQEKKNDNDKDKDAGDENDEVAQDDNDIRKESHEVKVSNRSGKLEIDSQRVTAAQEGNNGNEFHVIEDRKAAMTTSHYTPPQSSYEPDKNSDAQSKKRDALGDAEMVNEEEKFVIITHEESKIGSKKSTPRQEENEEYEEEVSIKNIADVQLQQTPLQEGSNEKQNEPQFNSNFDEQNQRPTLLGGDANEEDQQQQQEELVSEDQMLYIAESLISQLAEKLLENQWTVRGVFDHLELVHTIERYEDKENIKAISVNHFLEKMKNSLGFGEITEHQSQCILRIIGKYDLDNAIFLDDLVTLLEKYGVKQDAAITTTAAEATFVDKEQDSPIIGSQNNKNNEDLIVEPNNYDQSQNNRQASTSTATRKVQSAATPASAAISSSKVKKHTRRDLILERVLKSTSRDDDEKQIGHTAYTKLHSHIVSYSTNIETLMDIFKAKSYMQTIKSKQRQSETMILQKVEFFGLIDSMSNDGQQNSTNSQQQQQDNTQTTQQPEEEEIKEASFTDAEIEEIELCIQLTPKIPNMYAIRHVETLFRALIKTSNADESSTSHNELHNTTSLLDNTQVSLALQPMLQTKAGETDENETQLQNEEI